MKPIYLKLSESQWKAKIRKARRMLKSCSLCARKCSVNRLNGEIGVCRSGLQLKINSAFPHFGEEKELVGFNGSGTIFLSNCNLSCVFCQNWEISQGGEGRFVSEEETAGMMLSLQERSCHNINWVSPTHFVPQLIKSLYLAKRQGLSLPVVYNTGGYDNIETIKLLKGVIDIYMPDMKYGSSRNGLKYSNAPNYWDVNRKVVKEMHKQVGDLKISSDGIAEKGLLIRHLVLPNNIAESGNVLNFISEEISKDSYINIMDQYRPCHLAHEFKELNRMPTEKEYRDVVLMAVEVGLKRGFL